MAECIHCGAPYVLISRKGQVQKLTRERHLDFVDKAIESARNHGRKPAENLIAHRERLANNQPW